MNKLLNISSLIIFFLIAPSLLLAQKVIKGIIIDSNTDQTIPYASVVVQNKSSISWKDGSFLFELDDVKDGDYLIVRCLGYDSYKTSLTDYSRNKIKEIRLKPKVFSLNEITVSGKKSRKTKIKTFGIYKKKPFGWAKQKYKQQLAFYISNDKGYNGIIQRLRFYIRKQGTPNKEFKVHLYSMDPKTNNPSKELLPEAIYAAGTTGDEWIFVDISQYQINFPSLGFFIAVEALPDSKTDTYFTYKRRKYKSYPKNVEFGAALEKTKDNLTWHKREPFNEWKRGRKPKKDEVWSHPMWAADILIFK